MKHAVSDSEWLPTMDRRAAELEQTGLSHSEARCIAEVELRISRWPEEWGNELRALIYGDFDPPETDLEFPSLGITVKSVRRTNTAFQNAMCVVDAHVSVQERSVSAAFDAADRLNTLVSIWTLLDWGNRKFGWWSFAFNDRGGGLCGAIRTAETDSVVAGLDRLPPDVSRRVRSALRWMREPKGMLHELYHSDVLRVYAGYWNAFECLVEAVCSLRPPAKMTKQQKQQRIDEFVATRNGRFDAEAISECYRNCVDSGFVAKASHALYICSPDRFQGYIDECFRKKPNRDRLYAIRNAINHGDIDSDSLQEKARVGDALGRLQMIVFMMLGRLIPFSCPVDPGPR